MSPKENPGDRAGLAGAGLRAEEDEPRRCGRLMSTEDVWQDLPGRNRASMSSCSRPLTIAYGSIDVHFGGFATPPGHPRGEGPHACVRVRDAVASMKGGPAGDRDTAPESRSSDPPSVPVAAQMPPQQLNHGPVLVPRVGTVRRMRESPVDSRAVRRHAGPAGLPVAGLIRTSCARRREPP
jgi:hypothetical protein